jgi:hypothetical protein
MRHRDGLLLTQTYLSRLGNHRSSTSRAASAARAALFKRIYQTFPDADYSHHTIGKIKTRNIPNESAIPAPRSKHQHALSKPRARLISAILVSKRIFEDLRLFSGSQELVRRIEEKKDNQWNDPAPGN